MIDRRLLCGSAIA